jgi:oxygen-independent coproporphyrinogen-3 oxidase
MAGTTGLPASAATLPELLPGDRSARAEGLYVHVPFCFHKCHYCDFYSIVDRQDRQAAFTDRLVGEAGAIGERVGGAIRTIFIGGGTPTLLRTDLWGRLLEGLRWAFDLSELEEFTVEANPETVTEELLDTLAGGGVNRLSLGAQSFDPRQLETLERWHDPANVGRAVELARAAGIEDINLDLIFAVPGQSLAEWGHDLARALELEPDHLACYGLTYEPNTPLTQKMQRGRVTPCEDDLEARMYETTIRTLAEAGLEHYEISNFARPGRRCDHNLLYWRSGNWLALGPSAAGHLDGLRWKNVPHLGRYLAGSGAAPVEDLERLEPDAALGEQLMLRFRVLEGVERAWLEPRLDERRRDAIEGLIAEGMLERTADHIRLTRRGLMLADSVVAELL